MRVHKHKQLALKQTRCEKTGSLKTGNHPLPHGGLVVAGSSCPPLFLTMLPALSCVINIISEPYRCLMTVVVSHYIAHGSRLLRLSELCLIS